MKKINKIFIITVLLFSIVFSITQKNYAVEETGNVKDSETQETPNTKKENENNTQNPNTNNSNTNNNQNNTQDNSTKTNNQPAISKPTTNSMITNVVNTTTNKTNTTKSSNANLTTLGIKPAQYDFTGFNNNTTSYYTKVPENIETVQVFAKTQDSKATLEGTGTKTLKIGKNVLEVTVTAEDGTTKVYTINVTRGDGSIEKEDEEGLKSLSIEGATLSPEFQPTTYEYTVKYIGEGTELAITTEPAQSDYVVEIIGNNDLQEGENIITILVSDNNGENVATYQLIVNKSLVDVEAIERQKAEERENMKKLIIGIIIGIVIIGIIIYIVIKCKKNKNNPKISKINDKNKNDNDDEEEVPKALRNKKNNEFEEQTKNDDDNIESEKEDNEQQDKKYNKQLDEGQGKEYNKKLDDVQDKEYDRVSKNKNKGKRFK